MYKSVKTYGHDVGLSCAFRQWRADSHCSKIHGYALKVVLHFEAKELDEQNWVADFGGLSYIKEWLKYSFDHTTVVSTDDPELTTFKELNRKDLINLRTMDKVGCEAFAEYIYNFVDQWVKSSYNGRVKLSKVEVHEHGANSASYS